MTNLRRLVRQYEPVLRFGTDGRGRPEAFFPMSARDYVHNCGLRRKKAGWLREPGSTLLNHLSAATKPGNCYLVFAAGDLSASSGVDPQITLELLDYDLEIAGELPAETDDFLESAVDRPGQAPRLLLDPEEAAELEARLSQLTAVDRRPATAEDMSALLGQEATDTLAKSLDLEALADSPAASPELGLEKGLEWLELPKLAALPQALRQRALEKYEPYRAWNWHPPVYHYHVTRDRGYTVLQYWFLYPYNDWASHGGSNDHEGDWEVIYVFLDADERPAYAAYSRHVTVPLLYGPQTAVWEKVEVVGATHPVVYVGCGSHASYFEKGDHRFFFNTDWARGNHLAIGPQADQAWGEPISLSGKRWNTHFSGPWGALVKSWIGKAFPHTEGPSGPGQKGDKWRHPAKWAGIAPVERSRRL
jgi:hypothetical protein